MSPKRTFMWTADYDQAFQRIKEAFFSPPVLATFDPALPSVLQTNASRLYGLGYTLLQDQGGEELRFIQCGSRFRTDTGTRYATIKLELLAVVWAMTKCKFYLARFQHFGLVTDHRPSPFGPHPQQLLLGRHRQSSSSASKGEDLSLHLHRELAPGQGAVHPRCPLSLSSG